MISNVWLWCRQGKVEPLIIYLLSPYSMIAKGPSSSCLSGYFTWLVVIKEQGGGMTAGRPLPEAQGSIEYFGIKNVCVSPKLGLES